MVSIKIRNPGEIDFDEITLLQRVSFQESSAGSTVSDIQQPHYYRWKYSRFSVRARIAELRAEGRLVAMSTALPQLLMSGNRSIMGWQICDIATDPSARGNGYFTKCLDALTETMASDEVFFGFPNKNSMRGTVKAGWKQLAFLNPYVGLTTPHRHSKAKRVEGIPEAQNELARSMALGDGVATKLSVEYLNERYLSPAQPLYSIFTLDDNGAYQGFIALRSLSISGILFCIVMDCHAASSAAERELLASAAQWGWSCGCRFILAFNSAWRGLFAPTRAMLFVPQFATPRPLILMGRIIGSSESFSLVNCHSQLGDWDGL